MFRLLIHLCWATVDRIFFYSRRSSSCCCSFHEWSFHPVCLMHAKIIFMSVLLTISILYLLLRSSIPVHRSLDRIVLSNRRIFVAVLLWSSVLSRIVGGVPMLRGRIPRVIFLFLFRFLHHCNRPIMSRPREERKRKQNK